jgi:hypothetical protein
MTAAREGEAVNLGFPQPPHGDNARDKGQQPSASLLSLEFTFVEKHFIMLCETKTKHVKMLFYLLILVYHAYGKLTKIHKNFG